VPGRTRLTRSASPSQTRAPGPTARPRVRLLLATRRRELRPCSRTTGLPTTGMASPGSASHRQAASSRRLRRPSAARLTAAARPGGRPSPGQTTGCPAGPRPLPRHRHRPHRRPVATPVRLTAAVPVTAVREPTEAPQPGEAQVPATPDTAPLATRATQALPATPPPQHRAAPATAARRRRVPGPEPPPRAPPRQAAHGGARGPPPREPKLAPGRLTLVAARRRPLDQLRPLSRLRGGRVPPSPPARASARTPAARRS
jgi:hypothetical protein